MSKNIKTKNKVKGNLGENIVNRYLEKYGYQVLARNFKCNFGEIDIIFKDRNEIVFCEIKTRMNVKYGFPAESVTYFKRKHIYNSSKYFLYKNNLSDEFIRFDVIEVYLGNKKPIINHIKSVFWWYKFRKKYWKIFSL